MDIRAIAFISIKLIAISYNSGGAVKASTTSTTSAIASIRLGARGGATISATGGKTRVPYN
jgi:hypothetical protein